MSPKPTIFVGNIFDTGYGRCKVIRYDNSNNITIKFKKTGYVCVVQSGRLTLGLVKDPCLPKVYGVGFMGVGDYGSKTHKKLYDLWIDMLKRCYDPKYLRKTPSYYGCRVSRRWHNFQTFSFDVSQLPNWNTPGFELDKDLRVWGNRIYGRKYCSFVPQPINSILGGRGRTGKYGVGVIKRGSKYYANCAWLSASISGIFNSAKLAEEFVINEKLKHLSKTAKRYKLVIHKEVYKTLRSITAEDLKDG